MKRKAGQRGIALIAVLWALVLLALIAATVLGESRSASRLARNLSDAARAEALADGGVHRAMAGLAVPVSAGGWRTDGTVYAWRQGGAEIRIRIEDEGGKIDLNRANGTLLRRLFEALGLDPSRAEALAAAIEDYRDPDDRRRDHGAEDPDYQAAGLPFGAKDAPFDAVDELQQVLGMNREIYAALAGLVTVHSRAARPDIRAAPPLIRGVLDRAEGREPRAGEGDSDGATGTVEPGPGDGGPRVVVLSLGPSAHRSRVRTYTIDAEARTAAGGLFARRAVVRMAARGRAPYSILAWDRGTARLFAEPPP